MKIIFLGTNGWYTTPTGNTPCILIDSKEGYIVFDAGNGIYKLNQYITEDKPISLFISHFHIDHVSGLHSLDKGIFPQGINIYVGKDRKKDFDTLVNPPFTSSKNSSVTELEGKTDIGFPVEIFEMRHAYTDHGYRVTLEGKIISYSGDTGLCDNSKLLAQDADLLIHECSWIEIQNTTWGHVIPTEAATLAKETGVKKLVLTHFDASKYNTLDLRKEAERLAQEIFPNTIAAVDDLVLEL